MQSQQELDYLRVLTQKYGSHYLKKYFGFTLKEIGDKLGIKKDYFSKMINFDKPMPKKYEEALKIIFKEMKIEEKTLNFKESSCQILDKELWRKVKNILTSILIFVNIISMSKITLFLNPYKVNFLECIVGYCSKNVKNIHNTLSVAFTVIVSSTLIFLANITHFFNKYRTSNQGVRFSF